jgi:hypothetical protein
VQFYVLRSFGDIVANHVGSGSLISELNVSEDIFVVQTDIPVNILTDVKRFCRRQVGIYHS